jgi:DNA (cytosine-5)-methyltransferase 1
VTFKLLDLFSGLGGFSLGLERTGCFQTVAFCDNDKYSNLVLQKHWKGVKIYNDVREITKQKLIADGIELPDIITGGFPCQPFSVAGKQKGTSDDRHLWPEMFRIIKELTPRWIIGENVKGLVNLQDGMVFETVCTDLEGEGYEVRAFNIPAAGVGAPHRRERIWIVANSRRALRQGTELRETNEDEIRKEDADMFKRSSSSSESNVANTTSKRLEGQFGSKLQGTREGFTHGSQTINGWWDIEPNVGRVAHGVSGRVHRLKGLGNSIVPQIAEEIGKAIIEAERLNEMCLYNS